VYIYSRITSLKGVFQDKNVNIYDSNMLSTIHGSDMSATRRRDKDTNVIIMKPSMVVNYNKYMGRVERSDQMISYTNSVFQ
jgi:hypothetical protein